jgi:hypothetical protein
MPFIDIYNLVTSHIGATASTQRAFVTSLINQAAADLYSQSDLVNCLREQVFVRDQQTDLVHPVLQFTLPYYVWKIRGIREYTTGRQILSHDMRPRYQTQGWKELYDPYIFRVKTNQVTCRDSLNEGALTINLPDGETANEDFTLFITGSNSSKSRFTEEVAFVVGDSQKVTSNIFTTVEAIRKSTEIDFDLNVLDADGYTISFIPNCEPSPLYTLIQTNDNPGWNPEYIEVLYKQKFSPFVIDSDEFPCGPLYDTAIYWKTLEYYYARKTEPEKVVQFYTKACEAVRNIAMDFSDNTEKLIDFGPNQYLNMVPSQISRTPLNPFLRLNLGRSN